MTVYNGVVSNFIQGVSQQNRKQRFEGQVGVQVNCLSNPMDGLKKRPGTNLLADIGSLGSITGSAGHYYERADGTEKYYIRVHGGAVHVVSLITGLAVTVSNSYNAYLVSSDPASTIRFCTVGDTTFISNSAIKVLTEPANAAAPNEYLIYCKHASYGASYYVQCDAGVLSNAPTGQLAAYTTDSTKILAITTTTQEVDKTVDVSTHLVMSNLWAQLETTLLDPVLGHNVTGEYYGDVIRIVCPSTLHLNLKAADTNHGNDLHCIHNEVDTYDLLPKNAFNGYKVKVTGTDKTEFNDYYLKYVTEEGQNYGIGSWTETLGWEVTHGFTPTTMPIKVTRNSGGTFDLTVCAWDARGAGDDDSNPVPSFVGDYISDIFMYNNRLVFLSKDNMCASVTGEFYNFFANTVTAQSDSDPIDSASSDNQVTNLKHGMIFNGSLVLFSNNAQFFHDGSVPFSTKNLSLAARSRFSNLIDVKPVTAGSSIFFVSSPGVYTNLREMTMESLTNNVQATKITEQASEYIQGTGVQMVADPMNNMLFLLTTDSTSLYVYQWYKIGNEVKQQAIHKWEFADPILYMFVTDGVLCLVQSKGTNGFINYIGLSDDNTSYLDFNCKLDVMIQRTAVADVADYYRLLLPTYYATGFAPNEITVIGTTDITQAGKQVMSEFIADGYLYIKRPDGATGTPRFKLGLTYPAEVLLTTPSLRDQYNRILDDAVLRINHIDFDLRETGYLGIATEYYAYEALIHQFAIENVMLSSQIISHASLVLESAASIIDYRYRLPVRGDADSTLIRLTSESHLPFKLVQASWSGQYNSRGRRTQ